MENTTIQITLTAWQMVGAAVLAVFGVGAAWGSLMAKIGNMAKAQEDNTEVMRSVKHNLQLVCNTLIANPGINFDGNNLRTMSPVMITDEGQGNLDRIGFTNAFSAHAARFLELVDMEKPRTKYDVQIASRKAVMVLMNEPLFDTVKAYLYQNPRERQDIAVNVGGIYVRDRYLEAHPEIKE